MTPSRLALAPLVLAASLGTGGDEVRLARALDTVSAAEIRAELAFFADHEMRGRDTPSKEQRVAARFLRARLEQLGLEPGAGTSWFHEYPRYRRAIDPARTRVTLLAPRREGEDAPGGDDAAHGTEVLAELVYATDYFVPTSRDIAALEREGTLVWCGAGERSDFESAGVRGSWALCRASNLSARRRARYAEDAGALGLVLLPDPAGNEDPAASECARTTQYARSGLVDSAADAEEPFPQIFLALPAARRLVAAAGWGEGLPAAGARSGVRLRDVRAGSGPIALENVCALWPGSDPELSNEVLIVSAHYDHEGVRNGKVYPGADDNGSGSMGLLALAEALAEHGPMRRSILLLWLSGEEKGLWGSAAWTKAPTLRPGHRAVANLNIDMIGRNAPDSLLITPTRAHAEYNGLTRLAESLAPHEGFASLGSADEYWHRSDHANFARNLRIPVAFLFSDVHEDYHQPTDTVDKIDCDKIRRVTRLVLRMLAGLQADELPR